MLQVKNNTAISPSISLFPNEQGVDTLYIVLKASFHISPKVSLLDEQIPPIEEDEYWGEPIVSSLKYASDMHLGKPSTDIILIGNAQTQDQQECSKLDVEFQLAQYQQVITVSGDRHWHKSNISKPLPFVKMPLTYENAYGGLHQFEKKNKQGEIETITLGEDKNPVGKGFIGKRKSKEVEGLQLPNLEHPEQLIRSIGQAPEPLCFGFISPAWIPRRGYAGTYDDVWQKTCAPYLPKDFDKRFFNIAHRTLSTKAYLEGTEPVRIVNASPIGELNFHLPKNPLEVVINFQDRTEKPTLFMETVQIEPDENRFSVTWRASVPCDKEALKIKQIDINYLASSQA